MEHYTFEQITIGLKKSFHAKITEELMHSFEKMTGDNNSLHLDSEFAKKKGFKDRVAYGLLVSSFLSTLAGVHIPGQNSVILSVTTNFPKPAYIGDDLLIEGTVKEKIEAGQMIKIMFNITNKDNVRVCFGEMLVKVAQ